MFICTQSVKMYTWRDVGNVKNFHPADKKKKNEGDPDCQRNCNLFHPAADDFKLMSNLVDTQV